jgi:hypothetical protein
MVHVFAACWNFRRRLHVCVHVGITANSEIFEGRGFEKNVQFIGQMAGNN